MSYMIAIDGVPGVGKSTAIKKIQNQITQNQEINELNLANMAFLTWNARLQKSGSIVEKERVLRDISDTLKRRREIDQEIKNLQASQSPPDLIIIDQSALNMTAVVLVGMTVDPEKTKSNLSTSALFSAQSLEIVKDLPNYLSRMPIDHVIEMQAPPEIRQERLKQRGDHLLTASASESFDKAYQNFYNYWNHDRPRTIIHTGSRSEDEVADSLRRTIKSVYSQLVKKNRLSAIERQILKRQTLAI